MNQEPFPKPLSGLRRTLTSLLDETDLRNLCFELNIDYETVAGPTKADKARELILFLHRRGRLADLLTVGPGLRPDIPWAEIVPRDMEPFKAPEDATPGSSPSVHVNGERNVAVIGTTMAPIVTGNIINSVMNSYGSLTRLQRLLLLAILVAVVLILTVVIWDALGGKLPSLPVPPPVDPNRLVALQPPQGRLSITAMALQDGDGEGILWFGAQAGTGHALYRLDVRQQTEAVPQHVLDVANRIIGLMVDCRGNLWLLLQDTGALVYRPATGQQSTLINRTTTGDWLTKLTSYAAAGRCGPDERVTVWLAREGVHTLYYEGDYPELERVHLVPWNQDPVYQASKELVSVRALHFEAGSETLWAANNYGQLLRFSFRGVLEPEILELDDILWSLTGAPAGGVWVGGSQSLFHIHGTKQIVSLVGDDGKWIGSGALTIAADPRRVWFGGYCSNPDDVECSPLGVHSSGAAYEVPLRTRKEVTGIVIDRKDTVWIGTEEGLILYSDLPD